MNKNQKIHFTVFSQAYYVDSVWGFGCPSGGMRNFGKLCHKHNIPVTWLICPKSARCEREMLTMYHDKYGDEAAMMFRYEIPNYSPEQERKKADQLTFQEYRDMIRRQKTEIEKQLPWAKIKIVGQGIKTANMIKALETENILGLYGHCYCQIATDSITDYGMPWGAFPLRNGDPHRPANSNTENKLIAMEWTMRDLNRSFHTAFPELWSTDPNDVERGGVCTDDNVEYWKSLFLEYEKALPLNENGIWFQFQQESHEQTWGEVCHAITLDRVCFCEKMMDKFFQWLCKRESVEFLTASEAAEKYIKLQDKNNTIPMYVPFKWINVPEELDFWRQTEKGEDYAGKIHSLKFLPENRLKSYLTSVLDKNPSEAMKNPPWNDSFFYFDHECQLVFDKNISTPVALFNYLNFSSEIKDVEKDEVGGGAVGFYLENSLPEAKIDVSENNIVIKALNHKNKILPYGVFLWEEQFSGIEKLIKEINILSKDFRIKISEGQGVFIRFNLKPDENIICIFKKIKFSKI